MKISDAVVVASFALGFGFFAIGLKVLATVVVAATFLAVVGSVAKSMLDS